MDPTGPSQPTLDTVYDQPANPAQSDFEQQSSNSTSASIQRSDPTVEKRERGDIPVPSQHGEEATPSSLGYGARDSSGDAGESVGMPLSVAFNWVCQRLRKASYNSQQPRTDWQIVFGTSRATAQQR